MKRSTNSASQRKREECSSVEENDDEKDETKRKSRNLSEKKRRDQFNMLINELCSMVSTTNRKMDKSSVLRATIAFLRTHSEVTVQSQSPEIQENWKPSFLSNEEFTHLMLEALDGFLIIFTTTGRILYTSESVTSLLGYLPGDLNGSIFDVVHESDKPSLHKLLDAANQVGDLNLFGSSKGSCFSLLIHMKHGTSNHHQTPIYEPICLVGMFHSLRPPITEDPKETNVYEYEMSYSPESIQHVNASPNWTVCFVALARLQTPQLLREMTVSDGSKNEFTSRHSLEWKFLFLDHRAPPIIGYLPFEVLGTSGYDYYHVDDLDKVAECHEALMQMGEGTSCYYRFLTKGQQWIWLQTRYFITYHQWNSKPEFIVCTHTVVSYEQVQESLIKEKSIPKVKDEHVKVEESQAVESRESHTTQQNSSQYLLSSVSPRGSLSSCHSELSSAPENYTTNKILIDGPFKMLNSGGDQSDENSSDYPHTPSANSVSATSTVMMLSDQLTELPAYSESPRSLVSPPATSQGSTTTSTVTGHQVSSISDIDKTLVTSSRSPPNPPTNDAEKCSSPILLNVTQTQLQDYLRRRHQLLQQQILLQQEELQRVSEQLMLVQFVTPSVPTTTVPFSHVTTSPISTQPETSPSQVHYSQQDMEPQSLSHSPCRPHDEALLSTTVASVSLSKPTLSASTARMDSEEKVHLSQYQQFFPHSSNEGTNQAISFTPGCITQHKDNVSDT